MCTGRFYTQQSLLVRFIMGSLLVGCALDICAAHVVSFVLDIEVIRTNNDCWVRLVYSNSELSCVVLRLFERAGFVTGHLAPSVLINSCRGRRAALVTLAW